MVEGETTKPLFQHEPRMTKQTNLRKTSRPAKKLPAKKTYQLEPTEGFVGWLGSGEISGKEFRTIAKEVTGAEGMLRIVLRHIIESNPRHPTKKSNEARLQAAMLELTGIKERGPGRKVDTHTPGVLAVVARLFFEQWYFGERPDLDKTLLRQLCTEALWQAKPGVSRWSKDVRRKRAKELADLFLRRKNDILVSSAFNHCASAELQNALKALGALGIIDAPQGGR